jgi:hypothetical protein
MSGWSNNALQLREQTKPAQAERPQVIAERWADHD